MYRKRMASLITAIKAATKFCDLHPLLADYEPPKPEPKKDLVQLAKEVQLSLRPASTTSSPSPSTTKQRKGGFKLKREKNTQRSLHDFFAASSSTRSEAPSETSIEVMDSEAENDDEDVEQTPQEDEASSSPALAVDEPPVLEAGSSDEESQEPTAVVASEEPKDQGRWETPLSATADEVPVAVRPDDPLVSRLEETINLVSQTMREGMDQINFVQKERQERKKTTTATPTQPDSSPQPCLGHRPQPRKLSAEAVKLRKQKMADDLIKSLLPYIKKERIGSKTAFKVGFPTKFLLYRCNVRS